MGFKNSREFQDLHTRAFLSDYHTVEWVYNINGPNIVNTSSIVRNLKKVNCDKFAKDPDLAIKENIHDGQLIRPRIWNVL